MINKLGKQYFLDGMLSSIEPNWLEQDATNRLFFLGQMTFVGRHAIGEEIITGLKTTVFEFQSACLEVNLKEVPEHLKRVVKYQIQTLELGLFYYQSMLGWFQNFLLELEERPYE